MRFLSPFVLLLSAGLAQDPTPAPTPEPAPPAPAAIGVGKPAPAFRVNDDAGRATAVGGASKTWTVLAFYPKASTGG